VTGNIVHDLNQRQSLQVQILVNQAIQQIITGLQSDNRVQIFIEKVMREQDISTVGKTNQSLRVDHLGFEDLETKIRHKEQTFHLHGKVPIVTVFRKFVQKHTGEQAISLILLHISLISVFQ
jgi:hypothetical protein